MEKQQLLYGVKYGDKVHFDFAVRLPVVSDTIEALRATDEACGTTEGAAANMYYRVAVMACAITALGDVPKEEITAAIESLHKGPSIRGEALTLSEFAALSDYFSNIK